MSAPASFLFATCQIGAEGALKHEMAKRWPAFRFAYSRPGFLTFKLPPNATPPDDLDVQCAFARAAGLSLGKAAAPTLEDRVQEVWKLLGDLPIDALHVWPRDVHEPGYRDFEPGPTEHSRAVEALLRAASPRPLRDAGCADPAGSTESAAIESASPAVKVMNVPATPQGSLVADVVIIDEQLWWVGYHRVHSAVSGRAGGFFDYPLPADAVSRVYLKMLEAVCWSEFPIAPGDRVAEIGCAPGGASQALLDLGARVVGIDPAGMHPLVLGHPRFQHVRRRSRDVPRRVYLDVDWLTCDINLPPNYALDTVEAVVGWPGVRLRGLLLTLKLVEWSMAREIPAYLDRIRSWGFQHVAARQLHHNRREVCVAASGFVPTQPSEPGRGRTSRSRSSKRPAVPGPKARRAKRRPPG